MEEALGEKATAIALIAAGRSRGKNLAKELGLTGSEIPFDVLADKLDFALGKDGTRLCKVDKITEENGTIKAYTSETLCSANEPQGSNRKCTFTMGAVWGAIESVTGKRLQGKQIESVLQGANHDVFEFTAL
jgi:predicted hydrocarbon binding protein